MLFKTFETYLKDRRGVFHIGANVGEERDWYITRGFTKVYWFEPNKAVFDKLVNNIKPYPNHMAINIGIHDTLKQATLHIASNEGQSSSILELGLHATYHPKVHYIADQLIKLERMDDFISKFKLDIKNFNFLNVDVQGVELNVIKSFGKLIDKLDYIYAEVNEAELYKGCALVGEIDEYLPTYNFIRIATHMTRNQWGDGFYIKKTLL